MAELEREAISARIAQARRDAGMTQEELADLLGVIPRTIQNYESHRVPWRHLAEIASITGKPQEWFLHGDEAPDANAELRDYVAGIRDELIGRFDAIDEQLRVLITTAGQVLEKLDQ